MRNNETDGTREEQESENNLKWVELSANFQLDAEKIK